MPTRPLRPCAQAGCRELVARGRCPKHEMPARDLRRAKVYDDRRGTAAERGYDQRWEDIRDAYRAEHPLCEPCERRGRVTPAKYVHHLRPLAEGGTNDDANLESVCARCHGRAHAELDRKRKARAR